MSDYSNIFPGVNFSLMAEGPVYKGLEDPKIYRRHDLFLLGVLARGRRSAHKVPQAGRSLKTI